MTQFNIKKGLSTNLFDESGKAKIELQEGCWYLTTDTAELYVALMIEGILTLKKANDTISSFDKLSEEVAELKEELQGKASIRTITTRTHLPTTGQINIVYIIEDENRGCIWNGTNYVWTSPEQLDIPDYRDIELISGGSPLDTID